MANQDATFLTDSGQKVRALTELVSREAQNAELVHIIMGFAVLSMYARGVVHLDEAEDSQ